MTSQPVSHASSSLRCAFHRADPLGRKSPIGLAAQLAAYGPWPPLDRPTPPFFLLGEARLLACFSVPCQQVRCDPVSADGPGFSPPGLPWPMSSPPPSPPPCPMPRLVLAILFPPVTPEHLTRSGSVPLSTSGYTLTSLGLLASGLAHAWSSSVGSCLAHPTLYKCLPHVSDPSSFLRFFPHSSNSPVSQSKSSSVILFRGEHQPDPRDTRATGREATPANTPVTAVLFVRFTPFPLPNFR